MKSKIISFISLSMVLTGVSSAQASILPKTEMSKTAGIPIIVDHIKELQLDRKLQAVGFPSDVLSAMLVDQKQHLIEQGVVKYLGTEKREYYYDESNAIKEIQHSPGTIQTQGTIPTTDLTLKITTSQLATTKDGKKRFTVTQNWDWSSNVGNNGDTFYNLTDKIGMSYYSDFEADPNTNGGYSCVHYGQHFFSGNSYWLSDCGGRTSELTYGGVGWNVDIRLDYRDYGWTAMNVMAKKVNTNWDHSTSFYGKYGHDTSTTGGLGLTIGPLSLNLNSGSSWDEASVSKSIYY